MISKIVIGRCHGYDVLKETKNEYDDRVDTSFFCKIVGGLAVIRMIVRHVCSVGT